MNTSGLHSHWQIPNDRLLTSTLTQCNYAASHAPYHGFVPPLVHLYTQHPLCYLRLLFLIVRHIARTLDMTRRPNGAK